MNDRFLITDIKHVIFVGREEYTEPVTDFSHKRYCNELIFHLSGESTVLFNGKQLEVTADTVRFLPQGEVWEYTVYRKGPGECIDIFFDTDIAVADEAFAVSLHQSEKIRNLFNRIFAVWVNKEDGYYLECVSLIYKIFAQLQKKNYMPDSQYQAIKPAIDYIGRHFLERKITAQELAACCTVSYPYIKKLFVKKFGLPPIRYSIQLKIRYACDLLKSGLYTITQTAENCGYRDVYFFSRQFKEYVGISPSAFIEKCRSSK